MRLFFLNIFLLISSVVISQNIIESYIYNYNNLPLAYASIYNICTNTGSISNDKGFFRVAYKSENDTIVISYVGYKNQSYIVSEIKKLKSIVLKKETIFLESANVYADVNKKTLFTELYKIFKINKKHKYSIESQSNLIAESYINELPLERIEAIGNLKFHINEDSKFEVIMGRFGQSKEFSFYTLTINSLLEKLSPYRKYQHFPKKISTLSLHKMIKNYSLKIIKENAKIKTIKFEAKNDNFFSGEIEYDKKTNNIINLKFYVSSNQDVGMCPVNSTDKINLSNFEYTIAFAHSEYRLTHISINYKLKYFTPIKCYDIISEISIFPTEYEKKFPVPFSINKFECKNIYTSIINTPFDSAFWNNHYYGNISTKSYTYDFFKKEGFITDYSFIKNDSIYNFLNVNNRAYGKERITIKDLNKDLGIDKEFVKSKLNVLPDDMYDLKLNYVLFPLDSSYVTKTFINVKESFFFLKNDINTIIALNIYIDIFEKYRRELDVKLTNIYNFKDAKLLVKTFYEKALEEANYFFKISDKGGNLGVLIEWNDKLKKKVGYDNIELLYSKKINSDNDDFSYIEKQIDYYNIGTAFLEKKKYNKAIYFFNVELSKISETENITELCNLYINRAFAYIGLKEIDKACNDFRKAKELGDIEAENYLQKKCNNQN